MIFPLRIGLVCLAGLAAAAPIRAQIFNAPQFAPGVSISSEYSFRQTSSTTIEPRGVAFTITLVQSLSESVVVSLSGNDIGLVFARDSSVYGTRFTYYRTFSSASDLNAAIPPGTYTFQTSQNAKTSPASIVISESIPPSLSVDDFDALQRWDGKDLVVHWTSSDSANAVDVGLYRANGQRVSNAAEVGKKADQPPIDAIPLRPGTTQASLKAPTATLGEVLTCKIKYVSSAIPIATSSSSFLFSAYAPEVPRGTRAVLEFPVRRAPAAPVITTPLQPVTVREGDDLSLSIAASSELPVTYQWRRNGAEIEGATTSSLTVPSARLSDAGNYSITLTTTWDSITSDEVAVTVTPRVVAPTVATPPRAQSVVAGTKTSLSVSITGTAPLTYQWKHDGTVIAGATGSTLTLDHPKPSDSGQYTVTATNSAGSITSNAAELKVTPVSRISNLSILSSLGSASDSFTLGFVVAGLSGSAVKPILIRAVGPSLAPLGVQGAVDDPKLELFAGSTLTGSNDNWAGDAALDTAFKAVGAFGFAHASSLDAAVMARVSAANNSIKVSGTGSGLMLAELYDATLADDFEIASPRLANVSVLKDIGSGLTTGFVVSGVEPVRLLVRAIGPTLGGFGVGGALGDPKLDLFQSGNATAMASNDNWGSATNASQVAAAAASVGAFTLATDSKDAVLLVTLAPGSYTAQVSGVNNSTGTALVEVYEVR